MVNRPYRGRGAKVSTPHPPNGPHLGDAGREGSGPDRAPLGRGACVKLRPLEPLPDDRDLLAAVATSSDDAAFAELCRRYRPRLTGFLRTRCGAETEEVVQEVLVTLWRKAERYDPERAEPSTWIFTIARNKAIDAARKRRSVADPKDPHYVSTLSPAAESAPDVVAARSQLKGELLDALAHLPSEQRLVLEGVYVKAQTLREVAEGLDIPVGTAKSRVRLALTSLRKYLAQRGVDHA